MLHVLSAVYMLAPCRCVLLQCLKCRTCDVVLGGVTLKEAFENAAVAMFNYMTPLTAVIVDESHNRYVCLTVPVPMTFISLPTGPLAAVE